MTPPKIRITEVNKKVIVSIDREKVGELVEGYHFSYRIKDTSTFERGCLFYPGRNESFSSEELAILARKIVRWEKTRS